MAQYIDKSALVAEIKRRQSEHDEKKYDYASSDHFWASVEDGKILSLIDTLEVKEVDLKLAYHDFLESHKTTGYMLFEVAEYFFELGLKAQKGEEV